MIMSLIPRNSLFDLDNFFGGGWSPVENNKLGAFAPRVDVKEKDKSYEITVDLPGVDKKDIHVSLNNGILSIEAETKQETKEEKDGKIIRQERRYGKFYRSFDMGNQIHEQDIIANYNNGVLTLVAPKVTQQLPSTRRIEVS
jgi:HSP20 family protein